MRDAGVANAIGLFEIARVARNGKNRDGACKRGLLQRATELKAVQPRDGQIGEHRIGRSRLGLLERLVTVVCFDSTESRLAQGVALEHPRADVVLDDEYERLRGHGVFRLLYLATPHDSAEADD